MLKVLAKFGYQATFLGNGQEALDYLADPRSPKPDIIFMDVCLVPREPPIDRMNQCTMLTAR